MNVKDFIQRFLIDEIGTLISKHPFPAFVLMSIGIEFLGKCLRDNGDVWETEGESRKDFEKAINELEAFSEYRNLLKDKTDPTNLYGILRCGLAHLYKVKYGITLGDKDNHKDENGIITVIGCVDFFNHFKAACEQVINNEGDVVKKDLNKPYIYVINSLTGVSPTIIETVLKK